MWVKCHVALIVNIRISVKLCLSSDILVTINFFSIQLNLYTNIYYYYYKFYMVEAYNSIAIVLLQHFFRFHHNNCFTNDPAKCMPKMAAILNFGGHLDFFHL